MCQIITTGNLWFGRWQIGGQRNLGRQTGRNRSRSWRRRLDCSKLRNVVYRMMSTFVSFSDRRWRAVTFNASVVSNASNCCFTTLNCVDLFDAEEKHDCHARKINHQIICFQCISFFSNQSIQKTNKHIAVEKLLCSIHPFLSSSFPMAFSYTASWASSIELNKKLTCGSQRLARCQW